MQAIMQPRCHLSNNHGAALLLVLALAARESVAKPSGSHIQHTTAHHFAKNYPHRVSSFFGYTSYTFLLLLPSPAPESRPAGANLQQSRVMSGCQPPCRAFPLNPLGLKSASYVHFPRRAPPTTVAR